MTPDRRSFLLAGGAAVAGLLPEVALADTPDADAKAFVDDHVRRIRPLEVAASKAWWDANITGKDEDFQRKEKTQNDIDAALADKAAFAELKALKDARRKAMETVRLAADGTKETVADAAEQARGGATHVRATAMRKASEVGQRLRE